MTTLRITDLRKRFQTEVLRGVNLIAERGSVTAILGENGSGKTTLLTCLLGLQQHAGSVDILGGEGKALPTQGSTFGVLDRFLLYPRWTVKANVNYFLNDPKAFDHQSVTSLVPRSWSRARAGTLSTGQVKLVMLGIAFASSAPVVVLDEFVNGLDESAHSPGPTGGAHHHRHRARPGHLGGGRHPHLHPAAGAADRCDAGDPRGTEHEGGIS